MSAAAPKKRPRGRPKGTHAPAVYTELIAVPVTPEQKAVAKRVAASVGESVGAFGREAFAAQIGDEWPRETPSKRKAVR